MKKKNLMNKNSQKNQKSIFHRFKAMSIVYCFYLTTFSMPFAFAQYQNGGTGYQVGGASGGFQGGGGAGYGPAGGLSSAQVGVNPQGAAALSFINQVGTMFQQVNDANLDTLRQRALAINANKMREFTEPDSDFPQCNLKPAFQQKIGNLCNSLEGGQTSKLEFQIASYWQQAAVIQEEVYRRLLLRGGEKKNLNIGLQCVEESRKKLLQRLDAQVEKASAEIAKYNQLYEIEVQRAREELLTIRDENLLLTGNEANKENGDINANSERIRKIYNGISACKNVLTSKDTGDQKGLYSIRDEVLEEPNDSASKYNQSSQRYSNVLDEIVNNIDREISDRGVGPIISRTGGEGSAGLPLPDGAVVPFLSAEKAFFEINEDYTNKYGVLSNELSSISEDFNGVAGSSIFDVESIQNWDRLSSDNFNEILQKGEPFFKEQYSRNCVSNPESKFNVGITQEVILSNLSNDERDVNKVGTSFDSYKTQIARLFAVTDMTVQDKINRLRQIEAQYSGNDFPVLLYQTYKGFGADKKYSPSELLTYIQEDCNTLYELKSDLTKARTRSPREVVQESLNKIEELRRLEGDYKANLKAKILNRVKNCEGITREEGPGTCNQEDFNTNNQEFCFKHASDCSNEIKSCLVQTNQVISTIQSNQKVKAVQFNNRMKNLVNVQQTFLNTFLSNTLPQLQQLEGQFWTNFKLPDSIGKPLAIRLPATEKAYGLDLIGGLDLEKDRRGLASDRAKINQLPDVLGAWKKSLEDYRAEIARVTQERIDEQEAQFEKERSYWEEKANQCTEVMQKWDSQIQEENARRQAQEQAVQQQLAELQAKVQKWCADKRSFDRAPGCGERVERLQEDASEISQYIAGEALASVDSYSAFCSQYQGDPNQAGNSSGTSAGPPDITRFCSGDKELSGVTGRKLAAPFLADATKARNVAGSGDSANFISMVEELKGMGNLNCKNDDIANAQFLVDELSILQQNLQATIAQAELRQIASGSHGQGGGGGRCEAINIAPRVTPNLGGGQGVGNSSNLGAGQFGIGF